MVFLSKSDDLKKKSLHLNSKGFSGRNQVISTKKKSSPKSKGIFRPKTGALQKEKGLHQYSTGFSGRNLKFKGFFRNQKFKGFVWPKSGDLQQKKRSVFISGGAVFIFGVKIGLKSTKNVLFCVLFRLEPPPLGYATAVTSDFVTK